jgi:hypothetical protein
MTMTKEQFDNLQLIDRNNRLGMEEHKNISGYAELAARIDRLELENDKLKMLIERLSNNRIGR